MLSKESKFISISLLIYRFLKHICYSFSVSNISLYDFYLHCLSLLFFKVTIQYLLLSVYLAVYLLFTCTCSSLLTLNICLHAFSLSYMCLLYVSFIYSPISPSIYLFQYIFPFLNFTCQFPRCSLRVMCFFIIFYSLTCFPNHLSFPLYIRSPPPSPQVHNTYI